MSHQPREYGIAPPMHETQPSPKWPWVLLVIVGLLVVGGVMYGPPLLESQREPVPAITGEPSLMGSPVPSPAPAKRVVVFEVTGTGKAFTITATAGASVQSESGVALPWTRTVEVPADGPAKSVMLVVVAGPDGAEVRGRYTINGTTVREGKASGPYGVLTITDS